MLIIAVIVTEYDGVVVMSEKSLLAIVELGGYPNFKALYEQYGFTVTILNSVRKAVRQIKQQKPDVVVAEFNYQSDFRDRTSSLETLMSVLQGMPDIQVIIFYDQEHAHHFQKMSDRFDVKHTLAFPIEQERMEALLESLVAGWN